MRKKIGLALGSGGSRGFCHIGVLQVLQENNIPIDYISGCSMGALAAACYACGATIEELKESASSVKQTSIMDLSLHAKTGFLKGEKAMAIANSFIQDKIFEETTIPLRITSCNLTTGKLKVFDSGSILTAVRASMSIPVVFKAVPEDESGDLLVDGGIIERIPIQAARDMGADIVIAVDALGEVRDDFKPKGIMSLASIIERAYLILDWESSRDKNAKADIVITPDQGDRALYVFKNNDYSIEQGRLKAQEMLPQILELING